MVPLHEVMLIKMVPIFNAVFFPCPAVWKHFSLDFHTFLNTHFEGYYSHTNSLLGEISFEVVSFHLFEDQKMLRLQNAGMTCEKFLGGGKRFGSLSFFALTLSFSHSKMSR